jgi:hypothetical protein
MLLTAYGNPSCESPQHVLNFLIGSRSVTSNSYTVRPAHREALEGILHGVAVLEAEDLNERYSKTWMNLAKYRPFNVLLRQMEGEPTVRVEYTLPFL